MVFTGLPFTVPLSFRRDSENQNVDGRLHAFAVEFAREDNLTFRDVSRKVGDQVGLVLVGMVRIGTRVMEPSLPFWRPARSYISARSVYR